MTAITAHSNSWLSPEKIRCGEGQQFNDAVRALTAAVSRLAMQAKDFHPDQIVESTELYADLCEDTIPAMADFFDAVLGIADGHAGTNPESIREYLREIVMDQLHDIRDYAEQVREELGDEV